LRFLTGIRFPGSGWWDLGRKCGHGRSEFVRRSSVFASICETSGCCKKHKSSGFSPNFAAPG
jgi:hypothetical protein